MSGLVSDAPTLDTVANILPPLVRGMEEMARSLDLLIDVACAATNLPEVTAEALVDLGDTLSKHALILSGVTSLSKQSGIAPPGRL
jgi:hypothetical protein